MATVGFDLARFEQEPVLGIIRGVDAESLSGVLDAVFAGGLRFVEITLNTPQAPQLIERAVAEFSGRLCLGAGTVRSVEDVKTALSAGAQFLVSPGYNEEVAACCREWGGTFFPGALTPTEIEKAWNGGAAMVKVFPASQVGPGYFRLLKGPFDDIKLMAVGGVGSRNVGEYLAAGASAVALGGSIISSERMQDRQFALIQKEIEEFLLEVRRFYSKIPTKSIHSIAKELKGGDSNGF